MQQENLFFDLDGTITDPKTGITRSVQYALAAFGIAVENPDSLCGFIGPPLKDSFMNFYGMGQEDAVRAVAKYREYYTERGMFENVAYPGIPEMLAALQAAGRRLILATSKPTVYAAEILRHFGLDCYFSFISGSNLDLTRCDKAEIITYALKNTGALAEHSVMIGDRFHDIAGAKKTGLVSVSVLYGYGSREEFEQYGADWIVEDVPSLKKLLLESAETSS